MKILRKYMAHYLDVGVDGKTNFVRLGKDLEEFTPELSAQVEVQKNILGENRVLISGYEKTAAVEPYYAEMGTPMFDRLQDIIDNDLVLDQLKTQVVDVKLWEPAQGGGYQAVCEEAYIEVTSYGGDTNGYRIGFTLHYSGNKTQGSFNVDTNTFTEAAV